MSKWKLYNNGEITKKFYDGEVIPEGWVPGYPKDRRAKILEKRKQTNLEKFGVDIVFKSEEAKEKIRQTNLKKYGVENPFQSEEIKEKIKESNLKKYGVEHNMQSDEIREKARQTNLERYGVEHTFQADIIKEKIKNTLIERYGVEYPLQSQDLMDKMKKSNLEKYGVEYAGQIEEGKEKNKATRANWTEEDRDRINNKRKQTNLEKYGVEHTFQSDVVKAKKKETYLEHYGVEHPSQSDEIKEKKKKTCLEHYGVEHPLQAEEVKKKAKKSMIERYGVGYNMQNPEFLERIRQTNLDKYGVPWACMRPEARIGHSNDSGPNIKFKELLESRNIPYEREFSLGRYVYDFKIGNILIEIDPSITHNSLWNSFHKDREGLNRDYHYNKSQTAEENGYRCIHIFSWDDEDKIINILTDRDTIYARICDIREVNKIDNDIYLNKYHLQGSCRGQDIRLGLYYDNELVSLMTFGKPRYNKKYEYELLRCCSNYNVIGGNEKIFKYFKEKYTPNSIISYCDRAKFLGKVYNSLGFKLVSRGLPSKHWNSLKTNEHITDNLLRARGFDQLFHTNYGKGTSNEELIIQEGYVPVYDCGQDTYVWERG